MSTRASWSEGLAYTMSSGRATAPLWHPQLGRGSWPRRFGSCSLPAQLKAGRLCRRSLLPIGRSTYYHDIITSVTGIMFLATPHRGLDMAFLGNNLRKLANFLFIGSMTSELLENLEPKSKALGDTCVQFVKSDRIGDILHRQSKKHY